MCRMIQIWKSEGDNKKKYLLSNSLYVEEDAGRTWKLTMLRKLARKTLSNG